MRTLLLIFLLIAPGVACAQSAPRALTDRNKADIVRQIKDDLTDGESARWRWPRQVDSAVYCGWVNAKNRMGAYAGWAPFLVIGTVATTGEFKTYGATFATGDLSDRATIVVYRMCSESGYDLSNPPPEDASR